MITLYNPSIETIKREYTINKNLINNLKEYITYFIQQEGKKYTIQDFKISHIPIKNDLNYIKLVINYKVIRGFDFIKFNRLLFTYLEHKGFKYGNSSIFEVIK